MTASIVQRASNDQGAIVPFFVLLIPALIILAGISFDASMLFAARREAYNLASSAARSGAAEVDANSLYHGAPRLSGSAASTARSFAMDNGADLVSAKANNTEVDVVVTRNVDMVFLGLVGFPQQQIQATASAEIKQGRDG